MSGRWRVRFRRAALVTLAALLTGCSGAVQSQGGSQQSKESFPWVTSSTIKVGALSPLTGALAVQGLPETNGNKAFFDYLNEKLGGIGGRKVQLVTADSQFNNQVAVQEFNGLAGQTAMLTQLFGTPVSAAVQPLVDQQQIIAQPASYGMQFYSDPRLIMFGAPYPIQMENLVDWARTNGHPGNGKWAIVYRDDALGKDQLTGFDSAMKYYKVPAGNQLRLSYEPSDTDFTAQIQRLAQFDAGNVLLATTADVAPRLVVGTARLGDKPTWFGSTPIWNPVLGQNTEFMQAISGGNYLVASPLPSFGSSNNGIVTARQQLKVYAPNQSPDPYFTAGWLEGYFTWKVLEQAAKNKDFSREGMQKASAQLGSTDFDGLLLSKMDLSKSPIRRITRSMEIDRVDLQQPGGLTAISPQFTGASARAFTVPTSR